MNKISNVSTGLKERSKASANPSITASSTRPPRTTEPARSAIQVLLADDHPIVRQGITSFLAKQPNINIAGQAVDGRDALRQAKELSPDIVLMDIDMPVMSGLTACDLLRRENPAIKVLVLSMHERPEYLMRILQSGARGHVLKNAPAEDLLRAVETVHQGGTFFSNELAQMALNQLMRGGPDGSQESRLSNREREVLVAIAEGLSNKEIACRLDIGVRTVETHRERIMRKLNIHSIAGLTKFAIQNGLIPMPAGPEPVSATKVA